MKGKRKRDTGLSMVSFLDILTCLLGALMLIIVITGIDAAQTNILVQTPIESSGKEKPIYIECRNNQLFLVPVAEARHAVNQKQKEVIKTRKSQPSTVDMMEAVGGADIDIGEYVIDFSRYLSGKIALMPKDKKKNGYLFQTIESENENTWLGQIVTQMDLKNERLNFLVRDDSFEVFKKARIYAWLKKAKVTYTLVPRNEPLIF